MVKVAFGEDSDHQRQMLPTMTCLDAWCIVTTMVTRGSFHNVPEDSKGLVYQLSGNPRVTSGLGTWAFYMFWAVNCVTFPMLCYLVVRLTDLSPIWAWVVGAQKERYTHKSLFSYGVLKLVGAELIGTHIRHWVRFNRASFFLAWLGLAKTGPTLGLSK